MRARRPDEAVETMAEQRALVALALVPGVGPGRIRLLIGRFGSASAAFAATERELAEVPGIGPQTARAVARFDDPASVDAQFARAEAAGASLVPVSDPHFPALLREIYDPPAFLWVRGDPRVLAEPSIAVVGTRRATDYGRRVAQAFARGLSERGLVVVSGLAFGVDAAAHRGTLEAGGRTVAVLGSGVDRIYPDRHAALAREIEARGAVVSEYPLGAAPDASNFPRRNRLVSGLTRGTLVVEAYETGGALITARLAVEQNREVFAVPSPVNSRAGEGTNRLIQQGCAKLVVTVDDVLEEIGLASTATPDAAAPAPPPVELTPVERRLLDALGAEPQHVDVLSACAGVDPSTALVWLLSLEFKGCTRQLAGQLFVRSEWVP